MFILMLLKSAILTYKDEEFPRYYFDSPELNALLSSDEWSWTEEERPAGSAQFIQVAAAQNLLNITKAGIQTMSLTDNEALKVKSMYPYWNEFISKSLTTGMKVQYNDKLYRFVRTLLSSWRINRQASAPQLSMRKSTRPLPEQRMIRFHTITI